MKLSTQRLEPLASYVIGLLDEKTGLERHSHGRASAAFAAEKADATNKPVKTAATTIFLSIIAGTLLASLYFVQQRMRTFFALPQALPGRDLSSNRTSNRTSSRTSNRDTRYAARSSPAIATMRSTIVPRLESLGVKTAFTPSSASR